TKTGINSSMLIGQPGRGVQSFSYTVPNSIASWPGLGTNYKIRVCVNMQSFSSNCALDDSSDAYFSITSSSIFSPSVTVLTPNGGETYYNLQNKNGLIGHSVKVENVTSEGDLSVYLVRSKAGSESSGWFLSSEHFSPTSVRFITEGTEYAGNFPLGSYYI